MTPFEAAAALQRAALDGGRETVERGLDVQRVLNRSLVENIESQRTFQRRLLGLQYVNLRRTLRRVDEEFPTDTDADLLRTLDQQVMELQADGEQTVETLVAALEGAGGAWESVTLDSLETAEQVAVLLALDGAGTDDETTASDP